MSEEEKIEPSREEVNLELLIVNKEPQTINNQTQTDDMEVHHHPHVEKKNFKEYFLEFIILFNKHMQI
ncbi:MAG TPA: hypothetical protein VGI61_09135 [Parafilimonas sp.]|jgi:hypothetical protein